MLRGASGSAEWRRGVPIASDDREDSSLSRSIFVTANLHKLLPDIQFVETVIDIINWYPRPIKDLDKLFSLLVKNALSKQDQWKKVNFAVVPFIDMYARCLWRLRFHYFSYSTNRP